MVEQAYAIIMVAFSNKFDLNGKPYVFHLERVASKFDDPELKCIALLHDLVEDCENWTIERLYKVGFSSNVCTAVDVLTRRDGEPYDQYIGRVASNWRCVRVKLDDLRDNMDLTRFDRNLDDRDIKRLVKYHQAYIRLLGLEDSY